MKFSTVGLQNQSLYDQILDVGLMMQRGLAVCPLSSLNRFVVFLYMQLEVLDRVYELLEGSNWPPGQLSNEAYRMAQFFQLKIEDAHFRVVDKALSTFIVAVDRVAQIFEAYLDRLMPLLFHKLVDQKDLIQKQAKCALEGRGNQYRHVRKNLYLFQPIVTTTG